MSGAARSQFSVILRTEVRRMWRDPLNAKVLLILPFVVAASLWPYTPSPLLPALIGAFLVAEPRFANFLFTSPREGEAILLFPRQWQQVIAAKNLSAGLYLAAIFLILAIAADYFSPAPARPSEWTTALSGLVAIFFPLVHLANRHAVEHPRRRWSWSIGDLAEGIIFLVSVAISAIPFFATLLFGDPLTGSILVCLAGGLFWWRVTLPHTARACSAPAFLDEADE